MSTRVKRPDERERERAPANPGEVDSFYHLPETPLPRATACQGTACFVARHLDPVRWQAACSQRARVYCLGRCHAGPADRRSPCPMPAVTICSREPVVLKRLAAGGAPTIQAYRKQGGYEALDSALRKPAEHLLRAVEISGLRGRGGAGFSTGRKWRAAAGQPAGEKYVVANADEGDPGAYIDRCLMEADPHALIEGMALAAHAIGASHGWIYLRKEYEEVREILRHALDECRAAGWLGQAPSPAGFSFDIELVMGRGSYVCGEETALLNALEGERPVVRPRPPYPTQHGLRGRPTLVQNVETLSTLPWIAAHGGEAYQSLGFSGSRGTKVVSLNSLFNRPGLFEIEFGMSVRHLVEDLGGGLRSGPLKGVIIGGPLAGIVPPDLLDTAFGFEELQAIGAGVGHGGVIGFDERTPITALLHHVFAFAAYESCGFCTPCRLGSRRMERILAKIMHQGWASSEDRKAYAEIVSTLRLASLCGLGTGLAECAESAFRHYGKEFDLCWK